MRTSPAAQAWPSVAPSKFRFDSSIDSAISHASRRLLYPIVSAVNEKKWRLQTPYLKNVA